MSKREKMRPERLQTTIVLQRGRSWAIVIADDRGRSRPIVPFRWWERPETRVTSSSLGLDHSQTHIRSFPGPERLGRDRSFSAAISRLPTIVHDRPRSFSFEAIAWRPSMPVARKAIANDRSLFLRSLVSVSTRHDT